MKTPMLMQSKLVSACLLCLFIAAPATAQKLPNVQQTSVYAPANIKIDGKATEWGDKFQAFNHATEIYYTIANDDDNLYLAIQATDPHIIEKILAGGLTFTVKNIDKKSKAPAVGITFPIVKPVDRFSIVGKIKNTSSDVKYSKEDVNNQFAVASKEILVTGIPVITDSVLSVYNDSGVKTAALFNDDKAFTYELCVPLKYLTAGITGGGQLNYNIRLNEVRIFHSLSSSNMKVISVSSVRIGSREADDMQGLQSPTDFSGNYILSKK